MGRGRGRGRARARARARARVGARGLVLVLVLVLVRARVRDKVGAAAHPAASLYASWITRGGLRGLCGNAGPGIAGMPARTSLVNGRGWPRLAAAGRSWPRLAEAGGRPEL